MRAFRRSAKGEEQVAAVDRTIGVLAGGVEAYQVSFLRAKVDGVGARARAEGTDTLHNTWARCECYVENAIAVDGAVVRRTRMRRRTCPR